MAKRQTRRTLSLNVQLYEQLQKHCEASNISMSQAVERLLVDVLKLQQPVRILRSHPPAREVTLGKQAREAQERRRACRMSVAEVHAIPFPVAPALVNQAERVAAFCAVCIEDIEGVPVHEPLGRDGAMVAVCTTCSTTPAQPTGKLSKRAGFNPRWAKR